MSMKALLLTARADGLGGKEGWKQASSSCSAGTDQMPEHAMLEALCHRVALAQQNQQWDQVRTMWDSMRQMNESGRRCSDARDEGGFCSLDLSLNSQYHNRLEQVNLLLKKTPMLEMTRIVLHCS